MAYAHALKKTIVQFKLNPFSSPELRGFFKITSRVALLTAKILFFYWPF